MCIHYVTSHLPHPISGQNPFYPLVLEFCSREKQEIMRKAYHFCQFEIKIAIQIDS
jgi:hypothetical protein